MYAKLVKVRLGIFRNELLPNTKTPANKNSTLRKQMYK